VPGTVSANREFGSSLRIETVPGTVSSALLSAAHEILTHFERLAPDLERQLAAHVDRPVPLQPALRDILDEHVLFVGDQVTGIIDFGAMRIESVAGDIARLLGSLVPRSSFNTAIAPTPRASIERSMEKVSGTFSTMPVGRPSVDIEKVPDTFSVANDTPGATARLPNDALSNVALGWQAGLSAYESVRPLSPLERELVDVFDRSGLLLGGMNWLQWLFVEGRQFADLPRVHARLTTILARLRG
jgi:Ser/Thr protein kinase RdoA (MazF antagonist)